MTTDSANTPVSMSIPSMPLAVMPELVTIFGSEEALMLSVLIEIVGGWQGQVNINETRLYSRLKHLNRQQQGVLLASLVAKDVLEVLPEPNQQLHINLMLTLPVIKPPSFVPSHTAHMATSVNSAHVHNMNNKANSYRASSGGRGRDDELSRIFAAKEAEIAEQVVMSLDWQPSSNILLLLQQNMNINQAFALGLRDEFIVYYMDKGDKKSLGGWDQKFLKWVKREQVHHQQVGHQMPHYKTNQHKKAQRQHEEARYTAKEKRRQLTETVLDIGNTDW